jgi:hypothetical protein
MEYLLVFTIFLRNMKKYLAERGKSSTFAPVQWNEGPVKAPHFT